MKNFLKMKASLIIAFAVIAALAFSCAPPLEETGYDWDATNARYDAEQYDGGDGLGANPFTFSSSIGDTNPEISVTFPKEADVLKKTAITAADLSFLTFSTFTTPAGDYKASVLDAPITFTVEKRTGDTVIVKLGRTFTGTYTNVIAKIDGTKFTFSGGLKMDRNDNGKTGEAILDDVYATINVSGASSDTFVRPGERNWYIYVNSPQSYGVNFALTGGTYATKSDKTTFSAASAYLGSLTADERKALLSPLAGQFTLQKWSSGDTWTDAGTAVWDDTSNGIYFKDIEFDHKGVYRTVWKGTAITTAEEYYGVKQVITFRGSVTQPNVKERDRTEIRSNPQVYNNGSVNYVPTYLLSSISTTVDSQSSDYKNVVLKVDLGNSGYYWDNVSLADFKKSFQIVYSLNGTPSNGASDLVYVDVSKIEYKAEDSAIVGGVEKGKNVLYITLDPSLVFDSNAYNTYLSARNSWDNNVHAAWEAAKDEYDEWWDQKNQYDYAQQLAQWQFSWAFDDWKNARDTWLADKNASYDPDDPDSTLYDEDDFISEEDSPKPVLQDFLDAAKEAYPPPDDDEEPQWYGNEPVFNYTGPKFIELYFRINDGISVSDTSTPKTVYVFGDPDNFTYDLFAFYGPVF